MCVQFNETGRGSVCSQAIMLVTDGAVQTYDAVFAQYNWPDRKVRRVSVFPVCGVKCQIILQTGML